MKRLCIEHILEINGFFPSGNLDIISGKYVSDIFAIDPEKGQRLLTYMVQIIQRTKYQYTGYKLGFYPLWINGKFIRNTALEALLDILDFGKCCEIL